MPDLFLDTGYVVALVSKRDEHHRQAHRLAEEVKQSRSSIVTTDAVLVEIGNALAAVRFRATAVGYVERLRKDPAAEIVPVTPDLLQRGFTLYKERQDKEWGWTDCISFIIMREWSLRDALTADGNFEQAGFNALLRV